MFYYYLDVLDFILDTYNHVCTYEIKLEAKLHGENGNDKKEGDKGETRGCEQKSALKVCTHEHILIMRSLSCPMRIPM